MGKTNTFELDLLKLLYQNIALANIGDAAGLQPSAVPGNFYVALFIADPGEAGSIANEADFTGYARVAVVRSAAGWTVGGDGQCSNTAAVTFAACTGGSNTITHFAVMKESSGDKMVGKAQLTAPLLIENGVTASFAIGDFKHSEA